MSTFPTNPDTEIGAEAPQSKRFALSGVGGGVAKRLECGGLPPLSKPAVKLAFGRGSWSSAMTVWPRALLLNRIPDLI